jgi:hypothetical protein
VLEQQVDVEPAVAAADPIDEVGIGGAQIGGDVAVLGDLKAIEIDGGEHRCRELHAQEVAGDLAAGEALAEVGVVGLGMGSMGGSIAGRGIGFQPATGPGGFQPP